jgi:hypothetical protein
MTVLLSRCIRPVSRLHSPIVDQQWKIRNRLLSSKANTLLQEEIDDANAKYSGKIIIRQTEKHGWGLYTVAPYKKGDLIARGHALSVSSEKTRHTIQTDWNLHAHMDLPARFINHACNQKANVGLRANNVGAYDFYAIHDVIHEDEELLWDYETAEYDLENFVCSCGAPNCRGVLNGYRHHSDEILKVFGTSYVAPYLLDTPFIDK